MDYLWILVGIIGLYFGGETLVKGASGLSLRYGLSPMIVGLTVVAFGTSAPELIVSLRSALTGHSAIAFGNVIGSNIANVLLILGVPALIFPIAAHNCEGGTRAWFEMIFATIILIPLLLIRPFAWPQGLVLLLLFAAVIYLQLQRAKKGDICLEGEVDKEAAELPIPYILGLIALGVVLLPLGADRLVFGASNIARNMGVPEEIVGLTIVAIGTSLPELAATLSAAFKRETDMAVGNVIGSNLFNILLILGATGMASTSLVDSALVYKDGMIMLGVSLLLGVFLIGKITIGKGIGALMIAAYAAYIGWFIMEIM